MFKNIVRKRWFWLLPALVLAGCQTPPAVKLSSAAASAIKTVRIVALEAPPLEVVPDLLQTRMPNYAHEYNMTLPGTVEEAVYLSPGGILIAGGVGHGDSVKIADGSGTGGASGQAAPWMPTFELAAAAEARLNAAQFRTETKPQAARLPIAAGERTAYLGHWREAVGRWYAQNAPATIEDSPAADAVLEVGIGRYRIFEGQTSLQVLLKLIDPRTGQVLAKTSKQTLLIGDTAVPALLYPQGEGFKALIRENGGRLIAEAMQDMGLTPPHLSELSAPQAHEPREARS
jgi:hypothetical protein